MSKQNIIVSAFILLLTSIFFIFKFYAPDLINLNNLCQNNILAWLFILSWLFAFFCFILLTNKNGGKT